MVMATGSGKSLIYQLPGLAHFLKKCKSVFLHRCTEEIALRGLVLKKSVVCISPLVSLMQDQVLVPMCRNSLKHMSRMTPNDLQPQVIRLNQSLKSTLVEARIELWMYERHVSVGFSFAPDRMAVLLLELRLQSIWVQRKMIHLQLGRNPRKAEGLKCSFSRTVAVECQDVSSGFKWSKNKVLAGSGLDDLISSVNQSHWDWEGGNCRLAIARSPVEYSRAWCPFFS